MNYEIKNNFRNKLLNCLAVSLFGVLTIAFISLSAGQAQDFQNKIQEIHKEQVQHSAHKA